MAELSDLPHKAPSPASRPKWKRYYVKGDIVPFEEDATHEFKGHRNLSVEDVPLWAVDQNNKTTRRAVSRTLNGFLNTGKGGTVYLGITDEGQVCGLNLTQYIKDHMVVAVDDLMSRYTPPVASHRYKIRFIPVVQRDATEEQIETLCNYDSSIHIDPDVRLKPHILRMSNYCWCDRDHIARINSKILSPDFVVEITIKPWDPSDLRNQQYTKADLKLPAVHEDEEGNCYFRQQGSVVCYSLQEVIQNTKREVHDHYTQKIEKLKEELFPGVQLQGLNLTS